MAETETVYIRGEGGGIFLMSLPLQPDIQKRLVKGYLTRVNADGTPYVDPDEVVVRPAVNAPKAEWIGWAVRQGMSPDDAEALTKTDLIDKFGPKANEQAAAAGVELTPEEAKKVADEFFAPANTEQQ